MQAKSCCSLVNAWKKNVPSHQVNVRVLPYIYSSDFHFLSQIMKASSTFIICESVSDMQEGEKERERKVLMNFSFERECCVCVPS